VADSTLPRSRAAPCCRRTWSCPALARLPLPTGRADNCRALCRRMSTLASKKNVVARPFYCAGTGWLRRPSSETSHVPAKGARRTLREVVRWSLLIRRLARRAQLNRSKYMYVWCALSVVAMCGFCGDTPPAAAAATTPLGGGARRVLQLAARSSDLPQVPGDMCLPS
jgi:hypothetical protein